MTDQLKACSFCKYPHCQRGTSPMQMCACAIVHESVGVPTVQAGDGEHEMNELIHALWLASEDTATEFEARPEVIAARAVYAAPSQPVADHIVDANKMVLSDGQIGLAHEIWAAAQLLPDEGIEDGVARISALLTTANAGKEEK